MRTADDALARLREIIADFEDFCDKQGSVTEADTRAKVVDAVLKNVCGWPEGAINREENVERGYVDYVLSVPGRKAVVVEAKREGLPFTVPSGTSKALKLSGSLMTDANVRDTINQVRGYCDDAGIRYAVATNGYAWIVFRAIRDDMPWRKGTARIFASLEAIAEEFTAFWNLLAYESVMSGSLEAEFSGVRRSPRNLFRVRDRLFNADLPLQRNRLHAQLTPVISSIFAEIADQDQIEILQNCYVHSASLQIVASDLGIVITDSIPGFLRSEGALPLPRDESGDGFSAIVTRAMSSESGELFLVLGGIGAGKTTFLKRYRRTVGKDLLDSKTIWFNVDFLKAPLDPLELEPFAFQEILTQLRDRYVSPHLETRRNIKRVFAQDIEVLKETSLRNLQEGTTEYEKVLDPYLERWSENLSRYVPGLLKECRPRRDIAVVIFVDNVDQLPPAFQSQVFLLAERITRLIGSATIVSLREESYYAAGVQQTFTAYANRKFHIASPRFRKLISNRIQFALKVLSRDENEVEDIFSSGIALDRRAIADFMEIVQASIFQNNRSLSQFIEAVSFGNMRQALQMFATFLTSGATDVDKMLRIYRREGSYYVAFHEFVKSITLGDRKYYCEEQSPVMNVFDCGSERNSSHFTSLRLLDVLADRRGESTRQGQGYVPLAEILAAFEDTFDNLEDCLRNLDRLVARQLVELNTRSTTTVEGSEFVRLTAAGWYYRSVLVQSFSYLDLVLQDTPLDDEGVVEELKQSVTQVDNLSDRDDQKLERMEVRFQRVDTFLGYLEREEERERGEFSLDRSDRPVARPIVQPIREKFELQREMITRRLSENRERYAEEVLQFPDYDDDSGDDDQDAIATT